MDGETMNCPDCVHGILCEECGQCKTAVCECGEND